MGVRWGGDGDGEASDVTHYKKAVPPALYNRFGCISVCTSAAHLITSAELISFFQIFCTPAPHCMTVAIMMSSLTCS